MNANSFTLALLLVGSFALGLSGDSRPAWAVDPNPCPQYKCRNVHALWAGDKLGINAFFKTGTSTASTAGWEEIFATTSENDAPAAKDGQHDEGSYPTCVPHCGKDKDGVWQAAQEVSPAGQKASSVITADRYVCPKAQTDDGFGPQVTPAKNGNTNKNSPPGY